MVCRVRCPIRLHVLSNHFAAISCPEVHALDGWGNRSGGPYVMVGLGTSRSGGPKKNFLRSY